MKLINLLPKEKQQELRHLRLLSTVMSLIWLTAASFVFVLLFQFGAKAFLQGQASRLAHNIESLKELASKEENTSVKNKVLELNNLVGDYKTLSSSLPKVSKVLRIFAPLVPEGVRITTIRIDPVRKTAEINGSSLTRELVIKLYNNIVAAEKNFPNIDYPLENVAKPFNIDFHFSFNISDEVMR